MANVKKKEKKKEKADGRCLDVRFNTSSGNGKSLMKSRIPFDNLQVYEGWYPRQTHQLLSAFPEAFLADDSSGNIAKALTWKHPCVKQKKKTFSGFNGKRCVKFKTWDCCISMKNRTWIISCMALRGLPEAFWTKETPLITIWSWNVPVYSTIGGL